MDDGSWKEGPLQVFDSSHWGDRVSSAISGKLEKMISSEGNVVDVE
jgi:hypothetical protein